MQKTSDATLWSSFYESAASIRATSGKTTKENALKLTIRNAKPRKLWEYCLHPLRLFNITAKTVEKFRKKPQPAKLELPPVYKTFFAWLHDAESRLYTPQQLAYAWHRDFGDRSWQAVEGMRMVLDKDPRCGVSVITYNQAATSIGADLLPNFTGLIASGYPLEDEDLADGTWYWSRKLDGVRCVILCDPNMVREEDRLSFISRNGRALPGLDRLREEILRTVPDDILEQGFALDGELTLKTKDGADDFKGIQAALNRKEYIIERVAFHAFDLLSLKDFYARKSETFFYERQQGLSGFVENYRLTGGERIEYVEQVLIETPEDAEAAIAYAFDQGWEGSIFRRNAPYRGRKSRDILKSKGQEDEEMRVLRVIPTTKAMKIKGVRKDVRCLGAVEVDYRRDGVKGSLKVGSGWSDKQRIRFLKHPEEIVGKLITVRYTQKTEDENGRPSVRNPRVKAIHGRTREM